MFLHGLILPFPGGSDGSDGKESVDNVGDQGSTLGWEDPLEKEMATRFSILAWRIPLTEKLGGLQSMGLQRIGHNSAINTNILSHIEKPVRHNTYNFTSMLMRMFRKK